MRKPTPISISLLNAVLLLLMPQFAAHAVMQDEIVQSVLSKPVDDATYSAITIDYPFEGSLFPPDIVAPTFLWHDSNEAADRWLIQVEFGNGAPPIVELTAGKQKAPVIDPEAISETNRDYQRPAYEVSARAWAPAEPAWEAIKSNSVEHPAVITIYGVDGGKRAAVSKAQVRIMTSRDPVAAPIFYRDVPLMPTSVKPGEPIKPIATSALHIIAWRLRDISKPAAPVLLKNMPTCANCHSFSSDGKTLGMDLDGPSGDKGAYGLVDISKEIVIEEDDILTWGSYRDSNTPKNHSSFGLFSRVSPDGRYVVSTVNEAVFVQNYRDFRFLQSFYPTKGILVVYDRKTGKMAPLPGASDPRFVQTNGVWSPDGKELVFSRAPAKEKYDNINDLPTSAGDDRETEIQYDLYRIPFNGGRGGTARPVKGASKNGMSNSFPKYSPDGKWIVFVQAKRGQLMRPDSRLYIIPAGGGEARKMNCNLNPMNSWHSWSPSSKWLVFSSKGFGPFTKMFLTHIDEEGMDTPAILIPNSTAANRAVNIPEFLNGPGDAIASISAPTQRAYAFYDQAWELSAEGKDDEALKNVVKAIEMNPYYDMAYFAQAVILSELGRKQEAAKSIMEFLRLNTYIDDENKDLVYLLAAMGRTDEAAAYIHLIIQKSPRLPRRHQELLRQFGGKEQAQTSLALHLLQTKDFKRAKEKFEHILQLNPQNLPALNGLAWILSGVASLGDAERAVALAGEACRLTHYQNPVYMDTLCAAYASAGRFQEAINEAEKALALLEPDKNPGLANQLRQRAKIYKQYLR